VSSPNPSFHIVGRYALHGEIASGGMATVHLGRLLGPVGFSRTVAIKRLHRHYAKDPEFVSMFLDEARLAARIQHPNVVQTLDVVTIDDELFLVMEYVQGETLSRLWRGAMELSERMPVSIVAAVGAGMLHGLHAAHEARDEHHRPLQIVHRDVSPQNVLVGVDGVPRILDFGVAKAAGRLQMTRDGQLKGKLAYMAPEQLTGDPITAQSDIYAAGVVIWESLTGERLFQGDNDALIFGQVLKAHVPAPSEMNAEVPRSLDGVILRALDRSPANRFATAREMAMAIEACVRPAQPTEVGSWVEDVARTALRERSQQVQELESSSAVKVPLRAQLRAHATSSDRDTKVGLAPPRASFNGPGPNIYGADVVGPTSYELSGAPPHSQGAAMNFVQGAGMAQAPNPLPLPDVVTRSWTHHTGGGAIVPYAVVSAPELSPRSRPPSSGGGMKVLIGIATAALVFAIAAAVFAIRGGGVLSSARVVAPTPVTTLKVPPSPQPPATIAAPAVTPAVDPAAALAAASSSAARDALSPPALDGAASPLLRTGVVAPQPVDPPPTRADTSATTTTKAKTPSAPPRRPPPRGAAPPAKPSCDPPYVRDAAGVKVYKPECLN